MIRLENGNSAIAQAESEREALQFAGVDVNLESIADDQKVDVPTAHWELVRSGLGPQNIAFGSCMTSRWTWFSPLKGNLRFGLEISKRRTRKSSRTIRHWSRRSMRSPAKKTHALPRRDWLRPWRGTYAPARSQM
jgi:hypothetical protein